MTNQEIRNDLAQALLAASVALGLLGTGLENKVEPAALSDTEKAMMHLALAQTHKLAQALAALGGHIRGGTKR